MKFFCQKVKNQHDLNGHSGDDYRVATLSKSYLTVTGIIKQCSKSIEQFKHM